MLLNLMARIHSVRRTRTRTAICTHAQVGRQRRSSVAFWCQCLVYPLYFSGRRGTRLFSVRPALPKFSFDLFPSLPASLLASPIHCWTRWAHALETCYTASLVVRSLDVIRYYVVRPIRTELASSASIFFRSLSSKWTHFGRRFYNNI